MGFAVRGERPLTARGLLVAVASLTVSRVLGAWASVLRLSGSRAQAAAVAHEFLAPGHVGSSPLRGRTLVSCMGKWILYH